jgi:hypothetical protein
LRERDRILAVDQRMAEVGRTTTTSYGLQKGKDDLFKSNLCAEFVSIPGAIDEMMAREWSDAIA